MVVVKFMSL